MFIHTYVRTSIIHSAITYENIIPMPQALPDCISTESLDSFFIQVCSDWSGQSNHCLTTLGLTRPCREPPHFTQHFTCREDELPMTQSLHFHGANDRVRESVKGGAHHRPLVIYFSKLMDTIYRSFQLKCSICIHIDSLSIH